MLQDLSLLVVLLLISVFISATEFAFVIANKISIELKARKKNIAAINAFHFIKNSREFFSTLLIGDHLANIAFASFLIAFSGKYLGMNWFLLILICAVIILIIGDILPKYFVKNIADETTLLASLPVRLMEILLYPFVQITIWFSRSLTKSAQINEDTVNSLFNREEIQMYIHNNLGTHIDNKEESDILNKILELGNRRVYEAMRPRTDIVGVEINSTITEVLNIFIESGYSKLPVYEDNLDNIKGVVFAYDLFKNPLDLKSIIRDVLFVPDTKICTEMITEFSRQRISFACAIDEFGGTAGILTMEDIIEELFGEIRDEYDTDDEICRKISENNFIIGGKVEIDYINENLNLEIPQGDYSTIAGFITYHIGRIPIRGESVTIDRFKIEIIRSSEIRIELVKVTVIPDAAD